MAERENHDEVIHSSDATGVHVPDTAQLEPDIGLGSYNRADRIHHGIANERRDNGPISFSHFLQHDVSHSSTSYPDLYSCARQDDANEGSVVDPESPDLPDFVQDHLAVEQLYFSDTSQPSNVNLPDFASFAPRNNGQCEQQSTRNLHRQDVQERRHPINRLPVDLPVNNLIAHEPQPSPQLPFDLTTNANVHTEVRSPSESNGSGTGGRLPDFLADGHVLGRSNSRRDCRNVTCNNANNVSNVDEQLNRPNPISMLRQENIRLRDELNILQSILMKKEDRIKELEDIVMALEISKLQMSSDANTQTLTKSTAEGEDEIVKLQCEKLNRVSGSGKSSVPQEMNTNLTMKIKNMTNTSEKLVRELLKIITDIQNDLHEND